MSFSQCPVYVLSFFLSLVFVHHDHSSLWNLILAPAPNLLFRGDFQEFGTPGQIAQDFNMRQTSNAYEKLETFATIFRLAKIRCVGPVNNKGSPHFFRVNGENLAMSSIVIITDGISLKMTFKHDWPTIRMWLVYFNFLARVAEISNLRSLAVGAVIPTHAATPAIPANPPNPPIPAVPAGFSHPGLISMSR